MFKTIIYVVECFILISLLSIKIEGSEEGFNLIGFPMPFYKEFGGKCFECPTQGFFILNFILDSLFATLIYFIIRKI